MDKNIKGLNLTNKFIGKYNKNINFFDVADSICNRSSDVDKLEFYCPLADSFSKYNNILSKNDLNYLKETYSSKEKDKQLELGKILLQTVSILKHSDDYYNDENYNSSYPFKKIKEFPSLRIYNIYFNEDRTVAIIAYNIIGESILHGIPNFFILVKKKNIWWKPIGDLKL